MKCLKCIWRPAIILPQAGPMGIKLILDYIVLLELYCVSAILDLFYMCMISFLFFSLIH